MITQTAHDPVCHMDIDPTTAAGTSEYQGKTYHFCAMGCKHDFDEDPEDVLKAEAEYDHSQAMDHGMSMNASATRNATRASWPPERSSTCRDPWPASGRTPPRP